MSNLFELFDRLAAIEDSDELDLVAHLDAIDSIREKVDCSKFAIDQLELQETYWAEKIKIAQQRKKVIQNSVERLKNYIASVLLFSGSETIEGFEYTAKLTDHSHVELKREVGDLDKIHHSDLLKVNYDWNKKAISERLKSGERLDEIASLKVTHSIRWKERNGTASDNVAARKSP